MKQIYLFILGLFLYSITAYGQAIDVKKNQYWVDTGVGPHIEGGASLTFSFNLISDSTLYKIRYMDHGKSEVHDYSTSIDTEISLHSFAMMFGKGHSGKYTQAIFSVGFGILVESKEEGFDYTTRRYYSRDKSIIPSIPMEIDLLLKPTKNLGFGITLWGDFNFNEPKYGVMLKLAIGDLR